jgi:hypothetical protein
MGPATRFRPRSLRSGRPSSARTCHSVDCWIWRRLRCRPCPLPRAQAGHGMEAVRRQPWGCRGRAWGEGRQRAGERPEARWLPTPKLARPERLELPTPRFVVWCSIQLSYGRSQARGCSRTPVAYQPLGRQFVQLSQDRLAHHAGADPGGARCHDIGGAQTVFQHVDAGFLDQTGVFVHAKGIA